MSVSEIHKIASILDYYYKLPSWLARFYGVIYCDISARVIAGLLAKYPLIPKKTALAILF